MKALRLVTISGTGLKSAYIEIGPRGTGWCYLHYDHICGYKTGSLGIPYRSISAAKSAIKQKFGLGLSCSLEWEVIEIDN